MSLKKIKMISTIGQRATVGLHLLELAKKNSKIMVITSDVSTSAGLDRFRKNFKNQYLDVGIAEQNLIGVAAGMASEGFDVITTTFAPFQTMRCCEQIKVNLGYMKNKVILIGLASGLVLGNLGYTHCSIEDIGVLRSIPNISIVSPADSYETIKAIEAALKYKNSVYIRITGGAPNPIVYENDYNFRIGKTVKLVDGKDVCIFVCGSLTSEALKAHKNLLFKEIGASVINVHTIKPLDEKEINEHIKDKKAVFSLEEHNVIGGLGSAISEIISSGKYSPPLFKIGINDNYDKGGSYEFLKVKNKLTGDLVTKKIIKELKNINS
tara:strand:+ start:6161 stop:7132 length:972 start_codon:yes stop_codon:yes gene_type:complete